MHDIRSALRAAFPSPVIAAILATAAMPMSQALRAATCTDFPDHLSVFGSAMASPFFLLLPLVVALLVGLPLAGETGHRFISSRRMRIGIAHHLRLRLLSACVAGFVALFIYSFATFVLCFSVWPLIGDPGMHGAMQSGAPAPSLRYTFSSLLQLGDLAYGVGYSAWLGSCGAIYAATTVTALLVIRNRFLALAFPLLLVMGESFIAEVTTGPRAALHFSAFPFGITPGPVVLTMLPHLVLAAVVGAAAVLSIRRLPVTGRLS